MAELFTTFTLVALQGFGGVLPVTQRELVDGKRWLDREQFVEVLAVAQVLPGPNVVNIALMIGDRFFGMGGAMAALAGMLTVPLFIVLGLAAAYAEFSHVAVVAGALRGMGAVAAGLILGTAVKLAPTLATNRMGAGVCAVFVLLTVVAVAALRWPLLWVIGGLGSIAIAIAWRRLGP
jgi:chromate transporter